jgi:hypothetical protein
MKYVMLHPTQPNSGMFAFIWQTIRGMYHYPDEKYYVFFGRESCYWDNSTGNNNVWDNYFYQPHSNTCPDAADIKFEVGLLHDEWSEFRDVYMPADSSELYQVRRGEYNKIIEKNVKLLPHIENKLSSYVRENFNGCKVLGIHLRGTDHPDKKPMIYYVDLINRIQGDYDKIFVTSDEESRASYIKNVYGDKVIMNDSLRSKSDRQLHYHSQSENNYKIGEDVILEAYLLSKCDFLICGTNSNVNYYTRALNPTLPYLVIQ